MQIKLQILTIIGTATLFLYGLNIFCKGLQFKPRRMPKLIVILAVFCILLTSCGSGKGKRKLAEVPLTREFPSVQAPYLLSEQEEIMSYLAEHFWDAYADTSKIWRCDSLYIGGVPRSTIEEQVGAYVSILSMIPLDKARNSIDRFYSKMEDCASHDENSNIFSETIGLMEKYLYDPNSPVRNEDIYAVLAKKLADSKFIDEAKRETYSLQAKNSSMNMAGSKAADFTFMDRNGRSHNLYSIESKYTLLFFSNPGCNACESIIADLQESEKIANMIKGKILSVVNIYIDEDLQAWRESLDKYPSYWHNGYDSELIIRNDLIYNIRAIPSLYLLDKDKIVIMKDATEEKVLSWLENIEE